MHIDHLMSAIPARRSPLARLVWLLGLSLLVPAGPVRAATVAGVEVPQTLRLGPPGPDLVLNGAGVRKKFFVKVYVGALYLPRPRHRAREILDADEPRAVTMHFLYRKVSREKLVDAWEEGFAANLSPGALQRLRPALDHFDGLFPDVVRGDVVSLVYRPGEGTRVSINGELRGTVAGADFNRALLSVWIGEHPAQDSLKEAMLGGGGG